MNFTISKIQKGAVISALPDIVGKQRPMVLLTDLSEIDCSCYAKDCLMLPMYTDAANEFSIPIATECGDGLRRGFVNPLSIIPVPYNTVVNKRFCTIGILPNSLIDLVIRIYTAYLTSNAAELKCYEDEVFRLRVEYMNLHDLPFIEHPHKYGIYRKVKSDGTMEFYEKFKDPRNDKKHSYVAIRERKSIDNIKPQTSTTGNHRPIEILWDPKRKVSAQTDEALLQFNHICGTSSIETVMQLYNITKQRCIVYRNTTVQKELEKRKNP